MYFGYNTILEVYPQLTADINKLSDSGKNIMDIFESNINSEETLLKAFDVLHDAICDEDDIKYDSEKGTLDIIFDREFLEDPSKISVRRVLFIFHKFEFPIVKSHLHLEGLNFCKMHSKDKRLKTHMFNECRIK